MDDEARARLAGRRASHGVGIAVAVVFVGASAAQIIPAVFGAWIHPVPEAAVGSAERSCSDGIRGLARTSGVPGGETMTAVDQACARSSAGNDAWASLLRLRRAEEQLGPGSSEELEALRRDVFAHLPADLR